MISKVSDVVIGQVGGADTGKKLWSRRYFQYLKKGWNTKLILLRKW